MSQIDILLKVSPDGLTKKYFGSHILSFMIFNIFVFFIDNQKSNIIWFLGVCKNVSNRDDVFYILIIFVQFLDVYCYPILNFNQIFLTKIHIWFSF